ncbi:MAG: pyridoxamine kinase [Ruminococcaceae bacterium]|nr:pyridoxamine kinase [Oscillospiraceae bacterium]
MSYKRILTIQDISCVGQCSLTVALPVLSACGVETAVLPSAVLSTHTAGFSGYTFRDLTEDMPKIKDHWIKENIKFDAVYTGYLGSTKQIEYVADIFRSTGKDNCIKIVDPAMADNGKLYPGFDLEFVKSMKNLCAEADYLVPNISEACYLTDTEFKTEYSRTYIDELLAKLTALGSKNIILTGVSYKEGKTGVVVYENGKYSYYEHDKISNGCHGTGDIYASAFAGSLLRGKSAYDSAKIAADYVVECIKTTQNTDESEEKHWYGAKFEPVLYKLIQALN